MRDAHHFSGDSQADCTLQGPRPLASDRRLALGHPGKPNVGRGQSPLYDIRFRKISTPGGADKRNKQPKVKSLPQITTVPSRIDAKFCGPIYPTVMGFPLFREQKRTI